MKNLLKSLFNSFGKDWWIEVKTDTPRCTYYFGPFPTEAEAETAKTGYIEDLTQEGAQLLQVVVKQCDTPERLTIYEDGTDQSGSSFSTPAFSGQP